MTTDEAIYRFEVEAVILTRQAEHRTDGTPCWCDPEIEHLYDADVVIHREFDDRGH